MITTALVEELTPLAIRNPCIVAKAAAVTGILLSMMAPRKKHFRFR